MTAVASLPFPVIVVKATPTTVETPLAAVYPNQAFIIDIDPVATPALAT